MQRKVLYTNGNCCYAFIVLTEFHNFFVPARKNMFSYNSLNKVAPPHSLQKICEDNFYKKAQLQNKLPLYQLVSKVFVSKVFFSSIINQLHKTPLLFYQIHF